MTLIVLALDGLDAGLVEHFDASSFVLESACQIETFAHAREKPYTLEVWPTVATGLGPDEHGVTGSGTSTWDNPLLELASHFTGLLPEGTRGTLGDLVRRSVGEREELGRTEVETIFDGEGRVVRNWPGVGTGRDLQYAWDLMNAASEDMPQAEFERKLLGLCAEQFGWVREMLHHDVQLAGIHVHTLDAAGHAYAADEESLERVYHRVGEYVDELVAALSPDDDLLLLSDHGIHVTFFGPDATSDHIDPGSHSFRAFASATTPDLPKNVYDVRAWVERTIPDRSERRSEAVDLSFEQLRDLGYVR